MRENCGNHAKKFLLRQFSDLLGLVQHPILRSNLEIITLAATHQLESGLLPTFLFGKMHRYDAPKFIEGCVCYAVACVASTDATAKQSTAVYVRALCAMRDSPSAKEVTRYHNTLQKTFNSLKLVDNSHLHFAVKVVVNMLFEAHPLRSYYESKHFHVVVVNNLDRQRNEYTGLLGQPIERPVLLNMQEMRDVVGCSNHKHERVAVLENGSNKPLLVFVGSLLIRQQGAPKEAKSCCGENEDTDEDTDKDTDTDEAMRAMEAMHLGTTRLAQWSEHPSPPLMHTGGRTPMVRSFAFAYKSDSQYDHTRGLCKKHLLPKVRERSTLRDNKTLIQVECAPLVHYIHESFDKFVPTSVTNHMAALMERCSGRWSVVPNTMFTALGVHLNFAQYYHIDEVDFANAMAAVCYNVTNPNNVQEGGEFVLPELNMYLRPQHGDVVYWQTRRIIHGVAPFLENTTLERCSWVVFQTEDCSIGCLECEDTAQCL